MMLSEIGSMTDAEVQDRVLADCHTDCDNGSDGCLYFGSRISNILADMGYVRGTIQRVNLPVSY